jgi:hypothetical protein
MTPRDTRTGGVLEEMILPALKRGGYAYGTQVRVGTRFNGGRHVIDALAEKDGRRILISLKWQQVGGTAEQKVPYEVMCLAHEMKTGQYGAAYVVLGGDGWTLREFYTSAALEEQLTFGSLVTVMTLETFIGQANRGLL